MGPFNYIYFLEMWQKYKTFAYPLKHFLGH